MTEEERIAKEKASIDAMKNAKANMSDALNRIDTLERALRSACDFIDSAKKYVPDHSYAYKSETSTQSLFDRKSADLRSVL